MLFKRLGDITAKHAFLILVAWIGLLVLCISAAPKWDEVVQNGEFAFLPEDAPSRLATEGLHKAFPNDLLASTLVLLVRRESEEGLVPGDYDFVTTRVLPEIHRIAHLPMPDEQLAADAGMKSAFPQTDDSESNIVQKITWFADNKIGELFISDDKQATTIVMGLKTEFLDQANLDLVDQVEKFVEQLSRTPAGEEASMPAGLEISISGSATFGRDMIREASKSAKSTEKWTVILVVGLLIVIYRAPALAMIPLITVAVSTAVSLKLLSIGAKAGVVSLFNGIETYVTVLIYGAGVDYCLFLIARYREELDGGHTIEDAISGTLQRVGAALTASAGTVMCGIGMLLFAEFGKFRQAGLAITFGLGICLLAALTLTPAILRLIGRWAFWPNVPSLGSRRDASFPSSSDLVSRLQRRNPLTAGWQWIGGVLERRALGALVASLLLMLPFTIAGLMFFGNLSYGLLSELPDTAASVYGAEAVQRHFPAGEVAPLTVLVDAGSREFRFRVEPVNSGSGWQLVSLDEGNHIYPLDAFNPIAGEQTDFAVAEKNAAFSGTVSADGKSLHGEWQMDDRDYDLVLTNDSGTWSGSLHAPVVDFSPIQGDSYELIQEFTRNLVDKKKELGLQSVRSLYAPKGQRESGRMTFAVRQAQKKHARDYFVAGMNPAVTRLDLVFEEDPFSRNSISNFRNLRDHIRDHLPAGLKNASLSFVGNTADISDLKDVTDSDQVRIDVLVLLGVYLILVVLLRRPGICAYLIFTVFYSYLATLGITYLVFWGLDPEGFAGLDWKVPMFLFTILIAVGEDYNIFLMARIQEEEKIHGGAKGITVALERTGSIISSCGIIMAGTFSSLMAGSLVGMDQLGFALALGVLLDTFVIRPIMVPSLLMLLVTGRLGVMSRWAGYEKKSEDVRSLAA